MMNAKPKVLAVVSARGGSKGIPGKNLRPLAGKPLIYHALQSAQRAALVDRLIFCTESEELATAARKIGVEVPFLRPPDLALDDTPLILVTQFAMHQMDRRGFRADIIVQIQPTCPFLSSDRIDESVTILQGDPDATSAISLKRIEHEHPFRAKVVDPQTRVFSPFLKDIDVERFQARQDLPTLYCTSGALYTRRRALLEKWNGRDFCLGTKPVGILLKDHECINIDRPIDLAYAEFMMENFVRFREQGLLN
jgi:CMP-N,N'-diacetyllegionaminic acid synthase